MTDQPISPRRCSRCGHKTSSKPSKAGNLRRRAGGGYDHVDCSPGSPEKRDAQSSTTLAHRRAVQRAVADGEVYR